MDLETENRLAALLMEEARRLRVQAEKEGVGAYIRQPKMRGRPNGRFLTATVLGMQQANRAVEVNEMWRAHEKEMELDNKLYLNSKDATRRERDGFHADIPKERTSKHGKDTIGDAAGSSRKSNHRKFHSEEVDGLRDEEVEVFLQSRTKRGRGAIGSRMDEPGPYPVCSSSDHAEQLFVNREPTARAEWKRQVLGPEKPSWLLNDEHRKSSDRMSTKEDGAPTSKRSRSQKHEAETSRKKSRKCTSKQQAVEWEGRLKEM